MSLDAPNPARAAEIHALVPPRLQHTAYDAPHGSRNQCGLSLHLSNVPQRALGETIRAGNTIRRSRSLTPANAEHLDNLRLWKPCPGEGYTGPEACRPLFEMLARRGVWQTPTLVALSEVATIGFPSSKVSADHLVYANKALRGIWAGNQSLFAKRPDVVKQLRDGAEIGGRVTSDMARAGVGILAGCDSMIAGFCVHDELAAMVRGGMTPLAALQTATLNPMRYFGLEQTLGMAVGKRADLVLLDANPLTDITAILLGCGLRRREAAELELSHIQRREDHWAIVDLIGKGRHIRNSSCPGLGQGGDRLVARVGQYTSLSVRLPRR